MAPPAKEMYSGLEFNIFCAVDFGIWRGCMTQPAGVVVQCLVRVEHFGVRIDVFISFFIVAFKAYVTPVPVASANEKHRSALPVIDSAMHPVTGQAVHLAVTEPEVVGDI